jgi:hypothetical protein
LGAMIGDFGEGTFNQSGGEHEASPGSYGVAPGVTLAEEAGSTGTYNLSGGELTAYSFEIIGGGGTGIFNQSGGEHVVARYSYEPVAGPLGDITIAQDAGSKGTFNLSGGSLTAGTIFNNDLFNYSGGELQADIVNDGTFTTAHTTAAYTGTFTNNGTYISEYATQYFNDLIIGQNGYLVGHPKDNFYVSGDFTDDSVMNTAWNTKQSYLGFIGEVGKYHTFYVAGTDHGPIMPGYNDNFSWGTMDIAAGNILYLDHRTVFHAALYVRVLSGLDISGDTITNIHSTNLINMYYIANSKGNEYLQGLMYNLSGGGHLIPVGPSVRKP